MESINTQRTGWFVILKHCPFEFQNKIFLTEWFTLILIASSSRRWQLWTNFPFYHVTHLLAPAVLGRWLIFSLYGAIVGFSSGLFKQPQCSLYSSSSSFFPTQIVKFFSFFYSFAWRISPGLIRFFQRRACARSCRWIFPDAVRCPFNLLISRCTPALRYGLFIQLVSTHFRWGDQYHHAVVCSSVV